MATASVETQYTPEDLLSLREDRNFELIDGRLVEKFMGARASRIALEIMSLLTHFVKTQKLGFTFDSECSYQIFPGHPNRVRKPDGSFLRRGKLPNNEVPEGHIRIPPDLALEVVSPNDLAYEVEQKIEDYFQAGIPLIWLVFPATRHIMVFRRDGSASRLGPADELSGEDVLPGFTCRVEDLFADI